MPEGQLQAVKDDASDQNFRAVSGIFANLKRRLASFEATEAFLRLASPANRKFNRGKAEIEFPGASPNATALEVTHGLGTKEIYVALGSGNSAINFAVTATTETKFTVNATDVEGVSPAKGTKILFSWLATT